MVSIFSKFYILEVPEIVGLEISRPKNKPNPRPRPRTNIPAPIKFDVDRFRVLNLRGSKNRDFPLTRRVALTTVLHYRADCDDTGDADTIEYIIKDRYVAKDVM